MRNVGTPFLIRPRPLPGESSSSWRQRVGWANGYALFPVSDERTRRSDPDLGVSLVEVDWVASLHASTSSQVVSMTLRSLVGRVVSDVSARSQPAWWLRTRMGTASSSNGPMFCPHCLSEDQIPYYRLAWRLAFWTHCTAHRVPLLDQCPTCGCAPWPSGCGVQSAVHPLFTSFRNCWHCGCEYVGRPGPTPVDVFPTIETWIDSSTVCLGEAQASSLEALQALRAVSQLYLRRRSRAKIQSSATRWSQVSERLSEAGKQAQAIEHLSVLDRAVLVPAAFEAIKTWPLSFLSFCCDTGLTRESFSGAMQLQPRWMTDVVDGSLAKQNRFVSQSALQAAFHELQEASGSRPTLKSVRARLKWQGEKGLETLFPPKRKEATIEEWYAFLNSCNCLLDEAIDRPLRSRMAVHNDLVAILLETVDVSGFKVLKASSREDMALALSKVLSSRVVVGSRLALLLDRLLSAVAQARGASRRVQKEEHQSIRQTARRLRAITSELPNGLLRDVRVFSQSARIDGLNDVITAACDS